MFASVTYVRGQRRTLYVLTNHLCKVIGTNITYPHHGNHISSPRVFGVFSQLLDSLVWIIPIFPLVK